MPSTPPKGDARARPRSGDVRGPRGRSRCEARRRRSSHPGAGVELAEGDLIGGKYRLIFPLGEGGMGSVWLAYNEALHIQVAIKVLRPEVQGIEGSKVAERLVQEARSAAQLGHPAIVKIFDFGQTEGGDPYVVMELLEGEDLADTMDRRRKIDAAKAVRSLLPIAHALVTAHDKGIIHRDIKPENIFFADTESGGIQPKLIDFGVAKHIARRDERLTAAGAVMGSPGYMAPEQARGRDVDERSDVWAFCVVLYEMISGRLPFQGANYHALLRAIIEDDPPPLSKWGIDEGELWEILARGLSKDPDARWPSMRVLGVALADWLLLRGVKDDVCGASLSAVWMRERQAPGTQDAFDTEPPPHIRARGSSAPSKAVSDAPAAVVDDDSTSLNILVESSAPVSTKASIWTTITRVAAVVLIVLGLAAIWQQGVVQSFAQRQMQDPEPAVTAETAAATQEAATAETTGSPDDAPDETPDSEPSAAADASAASDASASATADDSASAKADDSASAKADDSAEAGEEAEAVAPPSAEPTPRIVRKRQAPRPKLKKPTF